MSLEAASLSRPGRSAPTNGDAVLADVRHGIFAVADGVGGSGCDDISSQTAIAFVEDDLPRRLVDATEQAILPALRHVLAGANAAVRAEAARRRHELRTTLTVVVIRQRTIFLAHSGDSRAYRVVQQQVTPLTDDHTFVADMVRDGLLSPDVAPSHPRRHLLSACLGLHERVRTQTRSCPLVPGQMVILCTDGVSDVLSDREIASCVPADGAPAAVGRCLLDAARANGGTDDMSVVVVKMI